MQPCGHFAGGEKSWHRGHLRVAIHPHPAHHVVRGGTHFHGDLCDIDIGQLFELVVHAGQLAFDMFCGFGNMLLNPRNIQKHAAMGTSPPCLHLTIDAAGYVVPREQLRRTPGVLIALRVAPAFFFGICGLRFVKVRNVIEHEALAFAVAKHTAFPAHALCDQNAAHAHGPNHAGGVELYKLHVKQFGPCAIRQGMAIARVFPAVAGYLEGAPDAARGQHHGLGRPEHEGALFAVITERAGHAPVIHHEAEHGAFHVHVHAAVNAVILQRADHFQTRTVTHMGEARVTVPAEIALQNFAVTCAVKQRAPGFQFTHAVWRFLRVQFRHPPVVQVLAATHGV